MAHIKAEHGGYMKYLETSQSSNLPEVSFEQQETEIAKTFSCEFCSKKFSREDTLLKQKRSHKITEKCRCEHCTSDFTLKPNLNRHQKEALDKDGNFLNKCSKCVAQESS